MDGNRFDTLQIEREIRMQKFGLEEIGRQRNSIKPHSKENQNQPEKHPKGGGKKRRRFILTVDDSDFLFNE